jgi:aspartate/methionine/tyrosine aminotransferase
VEQLGGDTFRVSETSFTKYLSMTGWRFGWLVLPSDLARPVECLAQNMFTSAPYISQATFDFRDELRANITRYRRSPDHLLATVPGAGFDRLSPAEGAPDQRQRCVLHPDGAGDRRCRKSRR